jgi:small-conductance mechanosensitive channel
MDRLLQLFLQLKTMIWAVALIVGVIVVLSILNRILQRNATVASGHRFRNQLIMFTASFFGLLVVILGLPIDGTTRGQLLSLIGIIISAAIALSSSTILGNAMAGIMLKTVRNFRSGDFVTVGDHFGRVTERGLFHTEIQTPDRDLTTLPNIFLATTPVTVVRTSGTVVSATVSLGYDIPHTKIEKLLTQAAEKTGLADPFVQIRELGDFSVTYRVAGLLGEVKQLISYRSRLRSAMLDALHGAQVEIVSPGFMNVRDFDPSHGFIAAPSGRGEKRAADAAPVEVVFDKAEVAESIGALKLEREKLDQKLKEAKQEAKEAPDDDTKSAAESRVAMLEAEALKLDQTISATEAREKEDQD